MASAEPAPHGDHRPSDRNHLWRCSLSFLVQALPSPVTHGSEHEGYFGSLIFRTLSSFTSLSLDLKDHSTLPPTEHLPLLNHTSNDDLWHR